MNASFGVYSDISSSSDGGLCTSGEPSLTTPKSEGVEAKKTPETMKRLARRLLFDSPDSLRRDAKSLRDRLNTESDDELREKGDRRAEEAIRARIAQDAGSPSQPSSDSTQLQRGHLLIKGNPELASLCADLHDRAPNSESWSLLGADVNHVISSPQPKYRAATGRMVLVGGHIPEGRVSTTARIIFTDVNGMRIAQMQSSGVKGFKSCYRAGILTDDDLARLLKNSTFLANHASSLKHKLRLITYDDGSTAVVEVVGKPPGTTVDTAYPLFCLGRWNSGKGFLYYNNLQSRWFCYSPIDIQIMVRILYAPKNLGDPSTLDAAPYRFNAPADGEPVVLYNIGREAARFGMGPAAKVGIWVSVPVSVAQHW